MRNENERLAALSAAVRESTLKRLRAVPAGKENWRPDPGAMSFADLARHLIECDDYVRRVVGGEEAESPRGEPRPDVTARGFAALLADLTQGDVARREWIRTLDLERAVVDRRVGAVTAWWMVARVCLDHETHHRGQIATYLRLLR